MQFRRTNKLKQEIIKVIENGREKSEKMYGWYKRFRTDEVPIFNRKLPTAQKINNKINHDFVSMLINNKVNHFLGSPVAITLDEENEDITQLLKKFKRYTAFNRVISEIAKQSALYGYGCLLAYIDKKGEFDFIECEPYNCYFSDNLVVREVESEYVAILDNKKRKYEVYDSSRVYIYEGTDYNSMELVEEKSHLFDGIPLFKIKNNKEELNEFYRVRKIIENLDKLYSDLASEVEQFRLAYIKFVGTTIDSEVVEKMIQTGAIELPEGADADFIVKTMMINDVLNLIKREEQNLFKIARNYDPTDTEGGGQLTNLGIYFKLAPINSNCKETIHYFTEGLYTLFEFYSQYLAKKGIALDPYEVEFQFTLATPRNILEEAQTQQVLDGKVSTETRLKLCSFVENPSEEKQKLDEELGASILDNYGFGDVKYESRNILD